MANSIRCLALLVAACLALLHVSQAHIELASYVDPNDVANSFPFQSIGNTYCRLCEYPAILPVLGDDNKVTPYEFTFCNDAVKSFSLNVGKGWFMHFEPAYSCEVYQFVALDLSKSTNAARFYYDCKQGFIYMCKDYQVFDQETGRCVKGGKLKNTLVSNNLPGYCGAIMRYLPASSYVCPSLLPKTIPSFCLKCANPFVHVLLTSGGDLTPLQYTYCADNGFFSLDIVKNDQPHTFYAPDCKDKLVQALDPSRKTYLARAYYDCGYGLRACPENYLFDAYLNKCTPADPVQCAKLYTGLENCPRTCGTITAYPSAYNATAPVSYKPTPYGPSPLNALPYSVYGK